MDAYPFPTVTRLAAEVGGDWPGYGLAVRGTNKANQLLADAIKSSRVLTPDTSLILFGSFARWEMLEGSDYDWAILVDGVVDNDHMALARGIETALADAELVPPGSSGMFGGLVFSHDLVHRVGGGADSNANLTRRMLMLLESAPVSLSEADSAKTVWGNVVSNILERYFEEDVHFTPAAAGKMRVPRFLLNDLTRYWRTICVDYAAKYRDQDAKKWAVRNAKLRFSRKLLYASGLALCLSCELDPPKAIHEDLFGKAPDESVQPFVERAIRFAAMPPLEYLAAFVDAFVPDEDKRSQVINRVFGSYNEWLVAMGDPSTRDALVNLDHSDAADSDEFQALRRAGADFARGLELLFFNRDRDTAEEDVSRLAFKYIGF